MKAILSIFILLGFTSYSQSNSNSNPKTKINTDSINWVKENPNWDKEVSQNKKHLNRLEISKTDKTVSLFADIKRDHRIFGYEKPDKNSKKMILFSVWTFDVKDNPCDCTFGSYYQITGTDLTLKYLGMEKSFIKVDVIKSGNKMGTVFFEKKWVTFEQ